MPDAVLYGETSAENDVQKIQQCRDIVKEINDFGVSQQQIARIIQFLAYELEDWNTGKEIIELTKKLTDSLEKGENEQIGLLT